MPLPRPISQPFPPRTPLPPRLLPPAARNSPPRTTADPGNPSNNLLIPASRVSRNSTVFAACSLFHRCRLLPATHPVDHRQHLVRSRRRLASQTPFCSPCRVLVVLRRSSFDLARSTPAQSANLRSPASAQALGPVLVVTSAHRFPAPQSAFITCQPGPGKAPPYCPRAALQKPLRSRPSIQQEKQTSEFSLDSPFANAISGYAAAGAQRIQTRVHRGLVGRNFKEGSALLSRC